MRVVSLLFVIAAAAAGAQSSAVVKPSLTRAAADTAKIGTYDLEVTTDDGTMTGALSIKHGAEGLAADLTVGANKPAVNSFFCEGDHYVLTGGHGTFTITYKLTFSRDSLSGSFKMSTGLAGTVRGAIRK